MIIPVIPFPLHMAALAGLCVFAAARGSSFPLKLTALYAALFYLTGYAEQNPYTLEDQIKFSALCSFVICEYVRRGPSVKYKKRFCATMILSITFYIFMYSLKDLEQEAYLAAQFITSSLTVALSAFEFYLLAKINGTNRSDPLFTKICRHFIYGWNGFRPDYQAVSPSVWQTGTAINRQTGKS